MQLESDHFVTLNTVYSIHVVTFYVALERVDSFFRFTILNHSSSLIFVAVVTVAVTKMSRYFVFFFFYSISAVSRGEERRKRVKISYIIIGLLVF